jgi:uncharacterized phage protein (TIGR01671 family)
MKEIEFRYWDASEEKYVDVDCMPLIPSTKMKASKTYKLKAWDDDVFEQYTGLKDKNGKKIFEGDVLTYDSDEVKFKGIACYYVAFENGYWCGLDVKKDRKLFCHNFRFKDTEIIGNIHQDKHLIK